MAQQDKPRESVGAYRDPKRSSSNPLAWILGLLALLVVLLLLLWAFGVFDGGDDNELENYEATPTQQTDPALNDPAADGADMIESDPVLPSEGSESIPE